MLCCLVVFFGAGCLPRPCYAFALKLFKGMMPYYVRIMEKKYCSCCQSNRRLELFTEPYKNSDKCRERGRDKWHRQTVERRDEVNERRRENRKSEEVKAREKAYKQKLISVMFVIVKSEHATRQDMKEQMSIRINWKRKNLTLGKKYFIICSYIMKYFWIFDILVIWFDFM